MMRWIFLIVVVLCFSSSQAQAGDALLDQLDLIKNPFESQMPKEEPLPPALPKESPQKVVASSKNKSTGSVRGQYAGNAQHSAMVREVPPPQIQVQGLVWGGKLPQAIIENQIVMVGDDVAEVKVVAISQDGVEVTYLGKNFILEVP